MTDDYAIDIGQDVAVAPKKRKTTYSREHPIENPKPPKRSRAEIQAEAAEKKAASIAKKKERASLQAAAEIKKQEQRRTSVKEVAAMEDTIRRKQKQHQLQAERPDLQTMETYRRTIQEAQASLDVANANTTEKIGQNTGVEIPPQSIIDTDSDGRQLGMENVNLEGEDEDEDDFYMPAVDNLNDNDSEPEEEEEDISSDEQEKTSKKKGAKMEKVRVPVISREFIWIYSQFVSYQRASYVQKFKPIARS
jgi:hypothetical protein